MKITGILWKYVKFSDFHGKPMDPLRKMEEGSRECAYHVETHLLAWYSMVCAGWEKGFDGSTSSRPHPAHCASCAMGIERGGDPPLCVCVVVGQPHWVKPLVRSP